MVAPQCRARAAGRWGSAHGGFAPTAPTAQAPFLANEIASRRLDPAEAFQNLQNDLPGVACLEWRLAPEDLLETLWPTDHTGQNMGVMQELYRWHGPTIGGMRLQKRRVLPRRMAFAEMFHAAAALNPDLTT